MNALGVEPGFAQAGRQRHREAAGVGGADQLLGISAFAVLERVLNEYWPQGALPSLTELSLFEISVPSRFGVTYGHDGLFFLRLSFQRPSNRRIIALIGSLSQGGGE